MPQFLRLLGLSIPYLVCVAAGVGSVLFIQRNQKPPQVIVKTEKVTAPVCPPCNGVDWDELKKTKGRNITLDIDQHLTTQVNGDSLVTKQIVDEVVRQMKEELAKIPIVKCKNR